ncbi:unnamed protein product, partial [Musa acuminata subsp. burmannicoides]
EQVCDGTGNTKKRQVSETARLRGKRPPCLVIRAVREENVLLAEWLTALGPACS